MKRTVRRLVLVLPLCLFMVSIAHAGQLEDKLLDAVENDDLISVKAALDMGANVNAGIKDGYPALVFAASAGNTEIVRLLLDRGADVNAVDVLNGWTPLVGAAYNNEHRYVVKLLLDKGANIETAENLNGWTPLIAAATIGHLDVVRVLINYGANVNAKDKKGNTALTKVRDVIERGKPTGYKAGKIVFTPLNKAENDAYNNIVRILKEAGAA